MSHQVVGRTGCAVGSWRWRWSSFPGAASDSGVLTGELNGVAKYDFGNTLDNFYEHDIETNPYFEKNLKSIYYDEQNLINECKLNKSKNFHFSLNVQSLNSKFTEIKNFLTELNLENLNINTFAMQEIWQIPYPDLFKIEGFSLYTLPRTNSKGGGVGFYVNSNLQCKVISELTLCNEKIFECLTLEIVIEKKSYIVLYNEDT